MHVRRLLTWPPAVALAIGVADGLLYLGFEWVVKDGTNWIWNDVVGSDDVRWRVVPLALVLSIALSLLLRLVRQPRWVPPHLDPLGDEGGDIEVPPFTALVVILLVGAGSLLAGASLGPEAALVAATTGLGAWVAARAGLGEAVPLLMVASAGALLVAFFGSLIPLLIPLLLVHRRAGHVPLPAAIGIVLAGLGSWGILWAVQGEPEGFGQIPSAPVNPRDYAAAVVLGIAAVAWGSVLRRHIRRLALLTERLAQRAHWALAGAVFGLVLGGLYLLGGESVQFSGSEGTEVLLKESADYSAWAFAGIVLVKLVVTAWSLSAGYRGGLVFPSVFAGVAVSLFVTTVAPDLAGPGVLLGIASGLLVEMTAPALGAVMVIALLPAKMIPLGLVGAAAAIITRRLIDHVGLTQQTE